METEPKINNTISIVVDPSHNAWVLGGLMRELRDASIENFEAPVDLCSPNSIRKFLEWFGQCKSIHTYRYVLFSSLTPLRNYRRFPFRSRSQKIGLWFTHNELAFSKSELKALNSCDVIFVHSQSIKKSLELLTYSTIVVVLGAIDPMRFVRRSYPGRSVAWVGTPVSRKRPELFLMIVKKNPDLTFKLLGKNWMKSEFSELINDFKNLEYVEINGALNSSDFDGCSTLLVTSEIEGGPMPIIEALASGIYPIGTDTGFLGDIQEFLGLPKSFVLPDVDDISYALRGKLKDSAGISPALREKILSLDFERLAKIIHVNLKNVTN